MKNPVFIDIRRAEEVVGRFRDQKVLVVGDLMLDRYIRGKVERISPEAPVPVVCVTQEQSMPGGAANVAMNVRALGGSAVVAGIIGRDAAGRELMALLRRSGVSTAGVLRVPTTATTEKIRILAERQQVVRVDREEQSPFTHATLDAFCARIRKSLPGVTAIVMADYAKGALRQPAIDGVLLAARRKGISVGFDPKDVRGLNLAGITMATPNCREAHVCAGLAPRSSVTDPLHDATLSRAARILLRKWRPELLIVTLGPQGMYLAHQRGRPQLIPTRAREVFDVSGAGDTVIATCMLAVAAGASHVEAAMIGNHAAGVVVGKIGTATCSPEELLRSIRQDAGGGA